MTKIGRYQITRELGRGAMGVVYHAIDPTIGRPVAIKTLRLREVDDVEHRKRLRERLFREARSAGALSHPGIVTIYDMDEAEGLAYIAMEFVDGETLEDILNRPQAMPRERVIEVLRQAAAALDYAHRKGVIHRDIKPANIMIDRAGLVKITDFGIAKITQVEGQTLTGVLIGTPNYMSPEQVQGHEIDGRSDQFSLAVIAYEMLCGERPFYGEQISTVVYKIVAEQPASAQAINKTLGEGIDRILKRGLAKKPERRFASCTAFITALQGGLEAAKNWRVLPRKAQQSIATAATAAIAPRFKPVQKTPVPGKPAAASVTPRSRQRGWLVPFFTTFLILVGLLAVFAWRSGLIDLPTVQNRAAFNDRSSPRAPALKPSTGTSQPALTPAEVDLGRPSPMPAASNSETRSNAADSRQPATANGQTDAPANGVFPDVNVMTDPAGAIATLDGVNESACQTPCKLGARSGVHTLTVSKEGYQIERREIHVGRDDLNVALISMRSANGMLLLTSDPSGASVIIDGKPTGQFTPVRVSLPAGPHNIAIEKDGVQTASPAEIHNGELSTLRLTVRRE